MINLHRQSPTPNKGRAFLLMELIIGLDHGQHALKVIGEIEEYSVDLNSKEVGMLTIKLKIKKSYGVYKCEDCTKIISIPGVSPGVIRVHGASKLSFDANNLEVSYSINHFYSNYEDACAAIMEEIIVRGDK